MSDTDGPGRRELDLHSLGHCKDFKLDIPWERNHMDQAI